MPNHIELSDTPWMDLANVQLVDTFLSSIKPKTDSFKNFPVVIYIAPFDEVTLPNSPNQAYSPFQLQSLLFDLFH